MTKLVTVCIMLLLMVAFTGCATTSTQANNTTKCSSGKCGGDKSAKKCSASKCTSSKCGTSKSAKKCGGN